MTRQLAQITAATLLVASLACSGERRGSTPDTGARTAEAAPRNPRASSDSTLVAAMIAANVTEIQAGQLAADSARNAQVQQFGRLMVTDHTALNQQVQRAAQQAGIASRPGSEAEQIGEMDREMMEELRGRRGAEFDREFMDQMVESHQETLLQLDRAAEDTTIAPDLRNVIMTSRQKVQQHLEQAQRLQQQVQRGS